MKTSLREALEAAGEAYPGGLADLWCEAFGGIVEGDEIELEGDLVAWAIVHEIIEAYDVDAAMGLGRAAGALREHVGRLNAVTEALEALEARA